MSLDDYVRRLTTTITQELQGPIEQSLRDLLGEAMERAQRDREEAVSALEQRLATLRADFEAAEARSETERQALLEQHAAALTALRDEVTAEVGQAVLLEAKQLARDEQAAAEEAFRAQFVSERESGEQALRAVLAAEREEAEQALRDELAREHERQMLEVEEAHQRALTALRDEEQTARAAAEQALRQSLASDFEERLEEARVQQAAPSEERLAEGLRQIDRAGSLTEALGALIEQATAESSRAALFLASGERVRGWRQAGFDADVSEIDLPLHAAGPIGLAVQTGDAVSTAEYRAGESSLPPWLLPSGGHTSLAMPVVVGGRAVAVIYCEGHRPSAIEILARHAGRCLEVLTFSRVTAPPARPVSVPSTDEDVRRSAAGPESDSVRQEESARRYARLLISELKLYNETAVEEGRRHRDLLTRLGPEVDRARRLYEEKIPAAIRERASWFDDELVRTLAGGDAGMLGQVT